MSNLGWYQVLTSMAKRVGGPKNLMALLLGGGVVIGAGGTFGGLAIKKKIKKMLAETKKSELSSKAYSICRDSVTNEGLHLHIGDSFKVLEIDGDACLIERIDDENNPYFVSGKYLETVSDFKI